MRRKLESHGHAVPQHNVDGSGNELGRPESSVVEELPLPIIIPRPPERRDPTLLHGSWSDFYKECPHWKDYWAETLDSNLEWPKGVRVHDGRMVFEGKLCVPWGLQKLWIRENHAALGHVGPERLWIQLGRQCVWADTYAAREYTFKVMKACTVCHACQRPHTLKASVVHTPIPDSVMTSVALYIFEMPLVRKGGKSYDCMVVCVDRHFGWIEAFAMLK